MEYEKLDPDFKKKWVVALRSGEYKQGEEFLAQQDVDTNEYSYCCLGVAGHLCGINEENLAEGQLFEDDFDYSDKVPKQLQGQTMKGQHNFNPIVRVLTDMNDGVGNFKNNKQSFEQIADWIEQNL